MRQFKFGDFAGFPLDQEVLGDMQHAYYDHIIKFLDELAESDPIVVEGCNVTLSPPPSAVVTVSPGLIYVPGQGLYSFAGVVTTLLVGNDGYEFSDTLTTLEFEDGPKSVVIDRVATLTINVESSSPLHYNAMSKRRWWMLLGKKAGSLGWTNVTPGDAEPGEYLEYKYNPVAGIVNVRGAHKHIHTDSVNPTMTIIGNIPEGSRPTKDIYARTSILTHGISPKLDSHGSLYLGDIFRIDTYGNVTLNSRKLYTGMGAGMDFLHFYELTYQL